MFCYFWRIWGGWVGKLGKPLIDIQVQMMCCREVDAFSMSFPISLFFFFAVVLSYHLNFSWTSPPTTKASRVKHLIWPEQLCSAFSTHDWSNQICNLWHRPQRLAGVWGVAVTTVKCLPDPYDFTPPLFVRICILRSKTLQHFYGKSAGGM